MKQIVCGICNDFRALSPKGSVSCRCGNVSGWWVDSKIGTAKIKAKYKELVRILGMNNAFLVYAFDNKNRPPTNAEWRAMHDLVTNHISEGYLFNKNHRSCPFILFRVGETSDVTWATDDEKPPLE